MTNMDVRTLTAVERVEAQRLITGLIDGIDVGRLSARPAVAAWLAVIAAELQPASDEYVDHRPRQASATVLYTVPQVP